MFHVFENGIPANNFGFCYLKGKGWEINYFEHFDQAVSYAKLWLGQYEKVLPPNWDGQPYDYNGYGDKISIKKLP